MKKRSTISIATRLVWGVCLPLLFGLAPAYAQPAKVFVNSAVLAIGERPVLLDLKSQRIISHGENFEPELSSRPRAEPRKVSEFRYVLFRDLGEGPRAL